MQDRLADLLGVLAAIVGISPVSSVVASLVSNQGTDQHRLRPEGLGSGRGSAGTAGAMTGGLLYSIVVGRETIASDRYQWTYVCRHPDCSDASRPTASRNAAEAETAARRHAQDAHPDDHGDVQVAGQAG
jgi:hypothetical protein